MVIIHLEEQAKCTYLSRMDTVAPLLEQVENHVIAANKNCPTQTVIAGSSKRCTRHAFVQRQGVRVKKVCHAFHSNIVAPAVRTVEGGPKTFELKVPHLPISTNVTGDWFPQSVPHIIDVLSQQIASPVEWIKYRRIIRPQRLHLY